MYAGQDGTWKCINCINDSIICMRITYPSTFHTYIHACGIHIGCPIEQGTVGVCREDQEQHRSKLAVSMCYPFNKHNRHDKLPHRGTCPCACSSKLHCHLWQKHHPPHLETCLVHLTSKQTQADNGLVCTAVLNTFSVLY